MEVYTPRVDYWEVLAGSAASGSPSSSSDPTHTSRLEFMLRDSGGLDRTGDVASTTPMSGTRRTELEVDFVNVPDGSGVTSGRSLDILIECSSSRSNTQGFVYAWSYSGQKLVPVPTGPAIPGLPGPPPSPPVYPINYAFYTPDNSAHVMLNYASPYDFISGGHLKLKLVHTNGSGTFTSKYDLVQVILYTWMGSDPQGRMGPQTQSAVADVNFDGVVDGADLDQYFEEWLEGVPSTDLNADRSVEEGDLDQFLEAYVTGT